ncbi:MAG: ABC transporter permease [Clostridia bacterium]|nr:ABC transporter permease [Clostridia bacterium]
MNFLKSLYKNKKLILQLGKNDFRNRFASTSLGAMWGFLQPFVFMMTYVIVFQFILKVGSSGDYPYAVWFLPGMGMWMFCSDAIINSSNSIRAYSYLVKKVVFPVDVIPLITLVSSSFIGLFLFLIATVVCICFGFMPNILNLIYIIFAAYCFIIAFTRFTSAVATLVPDFSQLLNILMQLFMWFTPIVWNLNMIQGKLCILFKMFPFTYLIEGFRQAFINSTIITEHNYLYTVIFWIITAVMFIWGNHVFEKNRKDFADVL